MTKSIMQDHHQNSQTREGRNHCWHSGSGTFAEVEIKLLQGIKPVLSVHYYFSARIVVGRRHKFSGCGSKPLGVLVNFDLTAIDLFLATDTESGPWHGRHAPCRDIFLTIEAHPVDTLGNPRECATDLPVKFRIPIEISNREFALAHQLHLIEIVGGLLDDYFVPVTQRVGNFHLLCLEEFR
jgi:hypothetical protein